MKKINNLQSIEIINNKGLLILIFLYSIITIYLMITKPIIYTNIINPIFWIMVILYINWYIKTVYIRFNNNKSNIINIIIISILHITIFFNIGFIFGFSKSPYNHSLEQILKNVCIQVIPIVGIELIRWIIVCRNKNNKFILFLITILLFLIEINYSFF